MKLKYIMMTSLVVGSMALVGNSVAGDKADAHKEKKELKQKHRKEMREHRSEHRAQKMLDKVDANKDGQIDVNEYLAHAQERFNKLDLDANGFVTQDEAKESMKKMRKEHREKRQKMRDGHHKDEG